MARSPVVGPQQKPRSTSAVGVKPTPIASCVRDRVYASPKFALGEGACGASTQVGEFLRPLPQFFKGGGRCFAGFAGRDRLACGDQHQSGVLDHDFLGIAAIHFAVAGAHIKLQAALHRSAGAGDALFEHKNPHAQIGHRVEGGKFTAKTFIFIRVHLGHHLHQALRAHGALGKGVEARLNGHDRQDQGGLNLVDGPDFIGLGDQSAEGFGRHPVFAAEPIGQIGLLFGQISRVVGGGAVGGVDVGGKAQGVGLALLQPRHQQ